MKNCIRTFCNQCDPIANRFNNFLCNKHLIEKYFRISTKINNPEYKVREVEHLLDNSDYRATDVSYRLLMVEIEKELKERNINIPLSLQAE